MVIIDFGKARKNTDARWDLESARRSQKRHHLDPAYNTEGGEGPHTDNWSYAVLLKDHMPEIGFPHKHLIEKWISSAMHESVERRMAEDISGIITPLKIALEASLEHVKTETIKRVRCIYLVLVLITNNHCTGNLQPPASRIMLGE